MNDLLPRTELELYTELNDPAIAPERFALLQEHASFLASQRPIDDLLEPVMDPTLLAAAPPTEEEILAALGDIPASDIMGAVRRYRAVFDQVTGFEMANPLYELKLDGTTELLDPHGDDVSRPIVCLASVLNAFYPGLDITQHRIRIYFPAERRAVRDPGVAEKYHIPLPESWHGGKDEDIGAWQRREIFRRLETYCAEHRVYPAGSSTERSKHTPPEVVFADIRLMPAGRLKDVIGSQGLAKWVYLPALFTNLDHKYGSPNARLVQHYVVTPDEMSAITEVLGMGRYLAEDGSKIGDGYGLSFPVDVDVEAVARQAHQLHGRPATEAELELWVQMLEDRHHRGGQIRWAEVTKDAADAFSVRALAKGTTIPIARADLDRVIREFARMLHAAPPEASTVLRERAEPAVGMLWEILHAPIECVVLVQGDQVKVGAPSKRGFSVIAYTYTRDPDDLATYRRGAKPEAYHVRGSSQQIMFLDRSAFPDLVRHMELATRPLIEASYTPHGLAGFVSAELVRKRLTLEKRQDALDDGDEVAESTYEQEEDALLSQAVLTSLISPINRKELIKVLHAQAKAAAKAKAREKARRRGEPMPEDDEPDEPVPQFGPGNLRMPRPIKRQFQQMFSDAYRDHLRTFGIYFHAYVNRTCENRLSTWMHVNGLERRRLIMSTEQEYWVPDQLEWLNGLVPEPRTVEEEYARIEYTEDPAYPISQRRHPFTSDGVAFVPRIVGQILNLDDDGDYLLAISAAVPVRQRREFRDGRGRRRFRYVSEMATVVLLSRYPQVDAPVLLVLPLGTPTPWQARTDEEETLFASLISVFQPTVDGMISLSRGDLIREDRFVLATSPRMIRLLEGKGVKQNIQQAEPIQGVVTLESTLFMVNRKIQLHLTGTLTRNLERFLILRELALERGRRTLAEFGIEDTACRRAAEEYARRALQTQFDIESQLTAIKKNVPINGPQRLALPEDIDVLGFGSHMGADSDIRAAILPSGGESYHDRVRSITGVLEEFDKGSSLERILSTGIIGAGKERNVIVTTILGHPTLGGGSGRQLVASLESISTALGAIIADLNTTVTADRAAGRFPEEADVRAAHAALEWWTAVWQRFHEERTAALEAAGGGTEEQVRAWRGQMKATSRVTKAKLRELGARIPIEALRQAVLDNLVVREQRSVGMIGEANPAENIVAILALCGQRLAEVFPLGAATVHVTAEPGDVTVDVVSRGRDLPGEECSYLDGQTVFVPSLNAYALKTTDGTWPLSIAHEDSPTPPAGARLKVFKITSRGALVVWNQARTARSEAQGVSGS